ncbi:FAD-dependent oxidoreductase [Streptomyces sp. NPDC002138]|uniref:FAD-dependent oxidoreductase n=1 Tax=Streptomyces sp. NPDC002138 TaxID=3154410 RepID=UPI00332C0963
MECDVLVIGGGIVGLSAAHALARLAPGTRVVVLEEEAGPGGRRSGIVHSGIQARPGSARARFAVRGAAEMVKFCAEHGIPHEVTGELILPTGRAELPRLHALAQRGRRHGIPVRELGPAQIREYEPEVRAPAAVRVGSTAIVDEGRVAAQLVRSSGAEVRYGVRVERIGGRAGGFGSGAGSGSGFGSGFGSGACEVRVASGEVLRAKVLVRCAGGRGVPGPGQVYRLARPSLVRGVVRVAPPGVGEAVHGVCLIRGVDGVVHVGGGMRRPLSEPAFVEAVRGVLPGVSGADLVPVPGAGGGGDGDGAGDGDGVHGDDLQVRETEGVVHVLNLPSEGAGVALPVGGEVARRALRMLRG